MRLDEALPPPRDAARRGPGRDYDALNKMVRKHKGALTRAKKKGARAVVVAVADAFAAFDEGGLWPDNWATWSVAFDDAAFELRFEDFDPDIPEDREVLEAYLAVDLRRP